MKTKSTDSKASDQIIDAAYHVLGEKGYDSTTIKEIARAANVAPGLIHYYFASKDDLLLAVLQQACDRFTETVSQLAAYDPDEDLMTAAFQSTRDQVDREPEWYRLRYELLSLGLRNPKLLDGLRELLAKGRQCIAIAVRQLTQSSEEEANAIAPVLLASFDGLALQKLADPEFDLDGAYQVLMNMVRSQLVKPSKSRKASSGSKK